MKTRTVWKQALIGASLIALSTGTAWATHRVEAEKAIAEAKEAHAKAEEVGAASPETAKMIEQAESLMPSRQYTKAVQVSTKAREQDTYAYEQATSGDQSDTAMREKAEQAIAAAEQARKKADSVGGEWRDTAKMIDEADGLAKSGEFDEAIALANKAKRQGELGYEQAMREQGAGFPSYLAKQQ